MRRLILLLLLVPCLLAPTSSAGGGPGLVNLPANNPVVGIPVSDVALVVYSDLSAAGYGLENGQVVLLGVVSMTGFTGASLSTSEAALATGGGTGAGGQQIRTKWEDNEGNWHEVETHVTGTNVDLYVKRHDRLVRAMKRYYPPKQ